MLKLSSLFQNEIPNEQPATLPFEWDIYQCFSSLRLCPLPLNMDIQVNAENSNLTEHMEFPHKIRKSINQGGNGIFGYFNTLTVITSSKRNCKMQFSAP